MYYYFQRHRKPKVEILKETVKQQVAFQAKQREIRERQTSGR
jgi:hypothetical protein